MSDWGFGGDVEESEDSGFAGELREALDDDALERIDVSRIGFNIQTVRDEQLLDEVLEAESRPEAERYVERQLESLRGSIPQGEGEKSLEEPSTESEGVSEDTPSEESEESESEEVAEEEPSEAESEPEEPISDGRGESADVPSGAMSFSDIRPDVQWKVMPWGLPGTGKTHFAMTMPEPIAFIDTESKADTVAQKFTDADAALFQVADYDEAVEAMETALAWLDERRENEGVRGTVVVDSMTDMWEWSQTKYVEKFLPMENAEEIDAMDLMERGSPQMWQRIKRFHNMNFRNRITGSGFHVCFTAREKDDINSAMQAELKVTPKAPKGEAENEHYVEYVVHMRKERGGIVGYLEKSGLTRYKFEGLAWPTFPKVREIVEDIHEAETSPGKTPLDQITDYDVTITDSVASRFRPPDHSKPGEEAEDP